MDQLITPAIRCDGTADEAARFYADIFRDMVIAGFALIECMSLIENIDRMGFGYIIPAFLRTKLKQIADEKDINKKKGDNKK